MTDLTNDQQLRSLALDRALQHHRNRTAVQVQEAAEVFYAFLSAKGKPLRIGDAHVRLVVDGGGQVIEGTVRDAVAECMSAEEAMRRREGAR